MLKKTKIMINTYWIVNSTHTISYTDRCTSCTLSIDHPSRAAIGQGGGIMPRTALSHEMTSITSEMNLPTACNFTPLKICLPFLVRYVQTIKLKS